MNPELHEREFKRETLMIIFSNKRLNAALDGDVWLFRMGWERASPDLQTRWTEFLRYDVMELYGNGYDDNAGCGLSIEEHWEIRKLRQDISDFVRGPNGPTLEVSTSHRSRN